MRMLEIFLSLIFRLNRRNKLNFCKKILFLLGSYVCTDLFASHIFQNQCLIISSGLAVEHEIAKRAISAHPTLAQFATIQKRMRELYFRLVVPDIIVNKSPYRQLPQKIDPSMLAPIQALWKLAHSKEGYFDFLQAFELQVFEVSKAQNLSLEEAFVWYVIKQEIYFGFAQPVVVNDFLSNADFLKFVSAGHPVLDEYWNGKPHSVYGHRVQSILQAMFIERSFGSRKLYSEVYRYMGRAIRPNELDWASTGIDQYQPRQAEDFETPDLYGYFYDTPFFRRSRIDPADFTNPEFFSSLRLLLPGLAGWR